MPRLVNKRLAEIYFDEKRSIYGHCYVKREDYSKKEQIVNIALASTARIVFEPLSIADLIEELPRSLFHV